MLVYGLNVLKELDHKKIKKVYTSRKEAIDYCHINRIKYEQKDNNFLNKFTKENHQGVIIDMFDYEYSSISDLEGDFVLILDHLEDPHNFGAIIRTCAAAGIKSIIIPKDRSVKVTDTVIKTSVGMIEFVKIIMVNNITATVKKLQDLGYFVYAADMYGTNYKKVDFSGKRCLIIGNEGNGVSHLVKESCDELISIPMNKNVESLNASVAAGILIFGMVDDNV
jgi:23S rRNA (guanosine2251-2'-O)-methyltransferase